MPTPSKIDRRQLVAGTLSLVGGLAAPAIVHAETSRLKVLKLQSPPSGPSITMSHAVATNAFEKVAEKVEFSLWRNPDQLRASLASGQVKVSVVPCQAAASLYNRGFPIRLVNVMTDGHCGLVSRGKPLKSFADLKGMKVAQPFFNDMTGHVMRRLLAHHNIALNELELVPAATHLEGAQLLLSGRVEAALLAEPAGTAAIMKGKKAGVKLFHGVRTNTEWALVTGLRPSLPQAGLAVTADFADAHPDKILALHEAVAKAAASANANPEAAAKHAGTLTERPAKLLRAAIPHCALTAHPASKARPELEAMYTNLAQADMGIIGGKLPDDKFYLL